MRQMLVAMVLTLLVGSWVLAECPAPPPAGTSVEIAPMMVVTSMECPDGMMDGRTVIEHKMTQYYANNRMVTMWMRPFPPQGMTEVSFVLTHGYGNFDKSASVDLAVVGQDMEKHKVELKRTAPGVYCGHGDFAPGWNEARVWITTPEQAYHRTFNFWAGDMRDKPRMVNWMCPRCRVTTVSTSCPVCCPL